MSPFAAVPCAAQDQVELAASIDSELRMVNDVWKGGGKVIVGKISPLPEEQISCRFLMHSDGQFCTAVADGRTLTFYAHGYDPLIVRDLRNFQPQVLNAGTLSMQKSPPANLRTWKARVDTEDGSEMVTATLMIRNMDFLFRDHGYAGGSPTVRVQTSKVYSGGKLAFGGLSGIPYQVQLSATGHVTRVVDIDPAKSGIINSEPLKLMAAPTLAFSYRTRIRKDGGAWAEDRALRSKTIVCDGQSELIFSDLRDGLGNQLELRLNPDEDGVDASFFYIHNGHGFFELGEQKISPATPWQAPRGLRPRSSITLKSGRSYLFQIPDVHGLDIQLLFSVE